MNAAGIASKAGVNRNEKMSDTQPPIDPTPPELLYAIIDVLRLSKEFNERDPIKWLSTVKVGLKKEKPISLMKTLEGCKKVSNLDELILRNSGDAFDHFRRVTRILLFQKLKDTTWMLQ